MDNGSNKVLKKLFFRMLGSDLNECYADSIPLACSAVPLTSNAIGCQYHGVDSRANLVATGEKSSPEGRRRERVVLFSPGAYRLRKSGVSFPGLVPRLHSQASFPGPIPRPHSQASFPDIILRLHSQPTPHPPFLPM